MVHKMYEVNNQLPKVDVNLPTCMFPVKSLVFEATIDNAPSAGLQSAPRDSSNNSNTLEARQDQVLNQLQDLLTQLAGIRSNLRLCAKPAQPKSMAFVGNVLLEEPLQEIVINAHPNYVPYALLALKNAWKDLFNVEIKTFSHSSIPSLTKEAQEFQKKLTSVKVDRTKPTLDITLIWKNCEHTEMIMSPTMYVPIYGEVNIVRYLGRVGPVSYRYENNPLCNDIDAVLDICYQLLRCSTGKARANLIRALNARLEKHQYFGGEQMSIADVAVCSTLKRVPQIAAKDLTLELNNWHTRAKAVCLI